MRDRVLRASAWAGFVLVAGGCCYLMLAACDLGIHPIFGLNYCSERGASDRLADQHARERDLRTQIHEAELRIARLPTCMAGPPPPPEPRKQVQNDTPPPPPPPPPPDKAHEELKIPQSLAELKGCWQSVRGDIPMVSDDAERRPEGNVRICYCFTDNGRGATRYIYEDGGKCIGPLRSRLSNGQLVINHGRINCSGNHGFVVPTEIDCSAPTEGDSATCDLHFKGEYPETTTDEKYQRVSPEHCY
jgi:hypothetical protein